MIPITRFSFGAPKFKLNARTCNGHSNAKLATLRDAVDAVARGAKPLVQEERLELKTRKYVLLEAKWHDFEARGRTPQEPLLINVRFLIPTTLEAERPQTSVSKNGNSV